MLQQFNNRFEVLSNHSDSSEFIDDVDRDPDFDPDQARPTLPNFVNALAPVRRIVSYSSSSDGEVDSSEIGPVNKIKSRKRGRDPSLHKQNKAKHGRNSGQMYVTKKGKIICEKTFRDTLCSCKMKCNDTITALQRKSLFESFWEIGDFRRQNAYICGLIQQNEIKQRRPRKEGGLMRSSSNKYILKSNNGLSVVVCKKYFLNTFCVSEGRVTRALKKTKDGKAPGEDLRGSKGCPTRKISEIDTNYVMQHILSFPSYQSLGIITKTENIYANQ